MKNGGFKKAVLSALALSFFCGLSFAAKTAPVAPEGQNASVAEAKPNELKDILFKLIRQDEYLDEAIDTIDASGGRLSSHELSAMALSLKMVKGNLDQAAAVTKASVTTVKASPETATYSKTILSYSKKVARKSSFIASYVAKASKAAKKKAALRDAPGASKGKKVRGKNLQQILAEQQAMDQLARDAAALSASSRQMAAASKWLDIVAR